jgi:putative ABC transport system substrate-binding protein
VIDRRTFLAGTGAVLLAAPLAAEAQPVGKVPVIGVLEGSAPALNQPVREAFRRGLEQLGWVEGRNVIIEYRSADGRTERFPELAAELVRLNVSVIVVTGEPMIIAARQATTTIPIVMAAVGDPVGRGFVASLARPGGNITGVSNLAVEMTGKWLELLKEAVPQATKVAALRNPANPTHAVFWRQTQDARGACPACGGEDRRGDRSRVRRHGQGAARGAHRVSRPAVQRKPGESGRSG